MMEKSVQRLKLCIIPKDTDKSMTSRQWRQKWGKMMLCKNLWKANIFKANGPLHSREVSCHFGCELLKGRDTLKWKSSRQDIRIIYLSIRQRYGCHCYLKNVDIRR
jgi:hypothetical protein